MFQVLEIKISLLQVEQSKVWFHKGVYVRFCGSTLPSRRDLLFDCFYLLFFLELFGLGFNIYFFFLKAFYIFLQRFVFTTELLQLLFESIYLTSRITFELFLLIFICIHLSSKLLKLIFLSPVAFS